MAYEGNLRTVPGLVAGEDLSSSQFLFGKINTSGKVVTGNTEGEFLDGVIQNDPDAADKAVTLADAGVTKVKCGGSVTAGDRIMGDANGKAVTAAAAPTAASKDSSVGPFDLAAGDTMVVDVDNVGNATATFDATAGYVEDTTTTYPCADQDGKTVILSVDGGDAQTVTFSGTTTSLASIMAQMNAQLVGCYVVDNGSTQPKIVSDSLGTGSTISDPTGTSLFTTNSDAPVDGTGDVVNIDAVTATEVKTVVENDTTAEVTVNADGSFTIASPTTGTDSELDFISGNCLTPFGFSVETITGSNPGTYSRGRALESGSTDELISAVLNGPTLNG
jgi:hypothetical protein